MPNENKGHDLLAYAMIVISLIMIICAIIMLFTPSQPSTATEKVAYEINKLKNMYGDPNFDRDVAQTFNIISKMLNADIAIVPNNIAYVVFTGGEYPNMTIYLMAGGKIEVAYYNGTYHVITSIPYR